MATNTIALGAAYQAGLLPLSALSIESAIALNGVQVEQTSRPFAMAGCRWPIRRG